MEIFLHKTFWLGHAPITEMFFFDIDYWCFWIAFRVLYSKVTWMAINKSLPIVSMEFDKYNENVVDLLTTYYIELYSIFTNFALWFSENKIIMLNYSETLSTNKQWNSVHLIKHQPNGIIKIIINDVKRDILLTCIHDFIMKWLGVFTIFQYFTLLWNLAIHQLITFWCKVAFNTYENMLNWFFKTEWAIVLDKISFPY